MPNIFIESFEEFSIRMNKDLLDEDGQLLEPLISGLEIKVDDEGNKTIQGTTYVSLPFQTNVPRLVDSELSGHKILFSNSGCSNSHRCHVEPCENPEQRASLVHLFWQTYLQDKRKAYGELLQAIQSQNSFHQLKAGPSVDERFPNWEAELKKRETEIQDIEKRVSDLVAKLPETERQSAIQEKQQRHQQSVDSVKSRLAQFAR